MKKNYEISVIVPAYNCEKIMEKCVESLENQTFKNFEVVFIDDGSKDSTLKELKKICTKNDNFYVYHKENGGVSSARNLGIEKSTGKYIMFVDSDDYIESNMLEVLYNNMKKHKASFVLCTLNQEFYKDGVLQKEIPTKLENEFITTNDANKIFLLFENEIMNGPYCKLFEGNIIRENNILFNPNLKIQEDLDFNINYLKYVKNIYLCSDNFYHYIMNNTQSITSKFMKERFDNFTYVHEQIVDYFKKTNLNQDNMSRMYYIYIKNTWSALINTFSLNNNFNFKTRKKYIKDMIDKFKIDYIKSGNRKGIKYWYLKQILLTKNASIIYFNAYMFYKLKQKFSVSYQ